MNSRVVVLFSADEQLQRATINATVRSGRVLRLASTVQGTLSMLPSSLDDVDLIILDLDSDICSVMLLNALSFSCDTVSVAVITDVEHACTLPPALSKGAVASLRKSVTESDISALIARVCSNVAS